MRLSDKEFESVLAEFMRGYRDAKLFFDDLEPEACVDKRECTEMLHSLLDLYTKYAPQRRLNYEQAGHDFWLDRQGHGAGAWDRGDGELGEKASDLAIEFSSY